jgi:hypothetical protein
MVLLTVSGISTESIMAQISPPAAAAPSTTQPPIKVPKGKWFEGERGFLEAKAIQDKTGMDMVIYFYNHDDDDEKGLCHWWEQKGMKEGKVDKLLETYLKVQVRVPLKTKEKDSFSSFQFNKTPAVFVAKTTGFPTKIPVFDWVNKRPQLRDNAAIADLIAKASTPKAGETTPTTTE